MIPFGIGAKRRRLVEAVGHAQRLLDRHLPGIGVFRLRPISIQAHLHTVLPPFPERNAWPIHVVEAERDIACVEIDKETENGACAHPAALAGVETPPGGRRSCRWMPARLARRQISPKRPVHRVVELALPRRREPLHEAQAVEGFARFVLPNARALPGLYDGAID
eukprot:scaffold46533_cov66-Phaeocystis_antarctica.AAC.10